MFILSLPHDAFTTKVTKVFADPSGCLLHAFGSVISHHEYYIEAQEERCTEQVREKEIENAEKRQIKEVYTNKMRIASGGADQERTRDTRAVIYLPQS